MNHRGEARVGFVITRGDPAERFEIAKEVLDEMTPAIDFEVAGYASRPIGLGWDHGGGAALTQLGADPVGIEGLVGKERAELDVFDERLDADAVVPLARQQDKARQIAERIDKRDDFARQTTAGSPDCLILSPP